MKPTNDQIKRAADWAEQYAGSWLIIGQRIAQGELDTARLDWLEANMPATVTFFATLREDADAGLAKSPQDEPETQTTPKPPSSNQNAQEPPKRANTTLN